jgi:NitT/TauT family transport system ATP-binding protein
MRVQLQGVSKTFTDTAEPLPALAPITLDIASGEFVCFIGPNGCGKSTLLRVIADHVAPTSGTIRIDGALPSEVRVRKQIAWMAQNPALLPWKKVLDNIRLPQVLNRRTGGQPGYSGLNPNDLLDMVELVGFAGAYPSTLSGGMQQRVALARTLAIGAGLWLMDEPFSALDELTRERLTEELLGLWHRFTPTVLWITHNIAEAARLADRIVVMTPSPGAIRGVVPITIDRPRDETTPEMGTVIRGLRAMLRK